MLDWWLTNPTPWWRPLLLITLGLVMVWAARKYLR